MKYGVKILYWVLALSFLCACSAEREKLVSKTEIMKWKGGKRAAISITFDDATINQFRHALPILDTLGFKGTFYINTADIPGSQFLPKFIGRPLGEIIKETASSPTVKDNLFERASALRFLDIEDAIDKHNTVGSLFEQGKPDEAYKITDDAYAIARKKKSYREIRPVLLHDELITWPELRQFAARGHEFGNHTISHPRLAVLDEPNLLYELEKCKEEILHQLGSEHTFSGECPFGTENERVMSYAYKIHPAWRNRMPELFLTELNRSSDKTPGIYKSEYIQWQRGPLQKTSTELMKSWVDTLLVHDNVWLVLTFHGIDGIGWEAKPHETLKLYFEYMKKNENNLWVAPFKDITKYMRERMNASVKFETPSDKKIIITLDHTLDKTLYDVPLTLKTYVETDWRKVIVTQGNVSTVYDTQSDPNGNYVLYAVRPDGNKVEIMEK